MADDIIETVETGMFEKVDELLSDTNKIPIQTALRLTLQLQRNTADAVNKLVEHIRIQNGRIAKLEAKTSDLQHKSIIDFIQNNPKLSIVYLVLFILTVDITVDHISSIASADVLLAVVRKWLGI